MLYTLAEFSSTKSEIKLDFYHKKLTVSGPIQVATFVNFVI